MKKILVTGAGSAAGIALIESLARDGFELFAADRSSRAAGLYLVPPKNRIVVEPARSPSFGTSVVELCAWRGIDLLISTVAAELVALARLRGVLESAGTKVLAA